MVAGNFLVLSTLSRYLNYDVTSIGHPLGLALKHTHGSLFRLVNRYSDTFTHTALGLPGMSGAPVILEGHGVIAVMTGGQGTLSDAYVNDFHVVDGQVTEFHANPLTHAALAVNTATFLDFLTGWLIADHHVYHRRRRGEVK